MRYKKFVILLAFTVITAYYISTFYYQFMIIQGNSMYPAYHNFQMVILDKYTETFHSGDVIAFRSEKVSSILVKRIAAEPGDSVLIKDGILYINGLPDASTAEKGKIYYAGTAENAFTLMENEFFVLGDNYGYSKDSRYREIGNVSRSSIIGKILL